MLGCRLGDKPGTSGPGSSGQRKPNSHRRALATKEYERLQAEGPSKDARCAALIILHIASHEKYCGF